MQRHVLGGMGLVALHSAHFAKIFTRLSVKPSRPIAAGVDSPIVIPEQEMYGEVFDIPEPDDLIFISSVAGGEVFRSRVTFSRGKGRIFYFSPGDQEYPIFHHPQVQRVIANGVGWGASRSSTAGSRK